MSNTVPSTVAVLSNQVNKWRLKGTSFESAPPNSSLSEREIQKRLAAYRNQERLSKASQVERFKVLRCRNEYWRADALFKSVGGGWICVKASGPLFGSILGKTAIESKAELVRMGCCWEWEDFKADKNIV